MKQQHITPIGNDGLYVLDTASWRVPALFQILQQNGKVDRDEMYQVFNMGIGMVLVVPKARAAEVLRLTKGKLVGHIVKGSKKTVLV